MPTVSPNHASAPRRLTSLNDALISKRIDAAPRLASLRSINVALSDLVYAENSFTSQIAEIIRRDPSLTSRLLRLVNSVFFGLNQRINSIEEAIFYLGLRQIRELAVATPIIEDFERLKSKLPEVDWAQLWRHSIGTAIMSREVLALAGITFDDDTDYIVGLVHNVGKIVLATTFPEEFAQIIPRRAKDSLEVCAQERALIGWDHARAGAYFLERHRLAPEIVEAVAYHNAPERAPKAPKTTAAVQVADFLVRARGIPTLENTPRPREAAVTTLSGWRLLFPYDSEESSQATLSRLEAPLARLPQLLQNML